MIQIITQNFINDMLQHPHRYITPEQDELILKSIKEDASNPTLLMLGYDEEKESYYFVVEDNEVSNDIYCETDKLIEVFDSIVVDIQKGGNLNG